ncbi:SDR family oxidoreductase [Burkholderia pyrrocinia]|uniref:SDR family oxidoreductase n=1 Tax=Burkholderia pyrrocinia TaxID=60550 RepID=UPI00158D0917|nr:SDR family oxidoreductase [Burkholderia pyrrocinia]
MRTDAPAFTARAIAAYRSSSSSTRSVLVAPKAANEALVKGLAREEGRCNVRANSILVGVIEAGMFPVLLEQGQFDQAWIDETQKMLALKRWGKAHDVGRAAAFLASDRADYVTGTAVERFGGIWVVANVKKPARASGLRSRLTRISCLGR